MPNNDPPNDRGVFINAPFDDAYRPLFRALIFAVADCGFIPHCSQAYGGSGKSRMENILDLIDRCPLSIHDLSRIEVNKNNLPRFNMPFELGICFAYRHMQNKDGKRDLLILGKYAHTHQEFISDLSGYDPKYHEDNPQEIIVGVHAFLRTYAPQSNSGNQIFKRYQQFIDILPKYCKERELDENKLFFTDLLAAIEAFRKRAFLFKSVIVA